MSTGRLTQKRFPGAVIPPPLPLRRNTFVQPKKRNNKVVIYCIATCLIVSGLIFLARYITLPVFSNVANSLAINQIQWREPVNIKGENTNFSFGFSDAFYGESELYREGKDVFVVVMDFKNMGPREEMFSVFEDDWKYHGEKRGLEVVTAKGNIYPLKKWLKNATKLNNKPEVGSTGSVYFVSYLPPDEVPQKIIVHNLNREVFLPDVKKN